MVILFRENGLFIYKHSILSCVIFCNGRMIVGNDVSIFPDTYSAFRSYVTTNLTTKIASWQTRGYFYCTMRFNPRFSEERRHTMRITRVVIILQIEEGVCNEINSQNGPQSWPVRAGGSFFIYFGSVIVISPSFFIAPKIWSVLA